MSEEKNIEKLQDFNDWAELEHEVKIPYTQISNQVVQNISSIEAGFIWVYLQTLPQRWKVNRTHIKNKFKIGDEKLDKIMSFLKQSNLIGYRKARDDKGRYLPNRIIVRCGSEFVQVVASISKITPDNFNYLDSKTHSPENQGSGLSTPPETMAMDNQGYGYRGHINKTTSKNETIKKTGTGKSVSSNISQEEKEALKLLKKKFNDTAISLKQMKEVLKFHTDKNTTLEWSINNYLYDLKNNNDNIKNLVVVFAKRLQKYKLGYYPDNRAYTRDENRKNLKGEVPHGLYEALMGNDISEAKKIARRASEADSVMTAEKRVKILDDAFNDWFKNAHQSIKDRFSNRPKEAIKEYFVETVIMNNKYLHSVYALTA